MSLQFKTANNTESKSFLDDLEDAVDDPALDHETAGSAAP